MLGTESLVLNIFLVNRFRSVWFPGRSFCDRPRTLPRGFGASFVRWVVFYVGVRSLALHCEGRSFQWFRSACIALPKKEMSIFNQIKIYLSKIQKNWCTVTAAPTIEHHARWTFTDPCKPEVRPGAREESASPAWLATPAINARDTTKVYIRRVDTGCRPTLYRKCHSHNTPGKRHYNTWFKLEKLTATFTIWKAQQK